MARMRAVVKPRKAPGVELQEVEQPTPKPNELLVRITATAICGSDLHFYKWDDFAKTRLEPPVIIGHEFCGEIVAVGSEARYFKVGDYIAAESHVACGRCYTCLRNQQHICQNLQIFGNRINGGLAEYAAVPESSARGIPKDWARELGAILEPLGGAFHATLVEPITAQTVLILGDGPPAIWSAGICRAVGARKVFLTGKHAFRLALARQQGADVTFNLAESDADPVEHILEETDGVGVDVVLEMTGAASAIQQALRAVRKGGRISQYGLGPQPVELDMNRLALNQVRWLGIAGRHMWDSWNQMLALLETGRFDPTPVITHRLPLERYQEGFDVLTDGVRAAAKVVLFP